MVVYLKVLRISFSGSKMQAKVIALVLVGLLLFAAISETGAGPGGRRGRWRRRGGWGWGRGFGRGLMFGGLMGGIMGGYMYPGFGMYGYGMGMYPGYGMYGMYPGFGMFPGMYY